MISHPLLNSRQLRRLDTAFDGLWGRAWFRVALFLLALLSTWLLAGGVAGD